MTTKLKLIICFGLCGFLMNSLNAQVTQANNLPVVGHYVGFNATSQDPLPIRNDGDPRIYLSSNLQRKISINELPTWNGLNGLTRHNVQRVTLGLQGETDMAWSMLHLLDTAADELPHNMQRDWMNVGTSYTSNIDFLYTGLLERPGLGGFGLPGVRTDAVFAWGCQDDGLNADNMRFIFLQETGLVNPGPASAVQGLEIMRLHPKGNVGIGNDFGNQLPPHRRLTVRQNTDSAQFRIAFDGHSSINLGRHADFQVPSTGNLHIKPRNDNKSRTVAIGFLQGELNDPINTAQIQTALDVAGVTRIRKIPNDHIPDCLVAGFNVGSNVKDNFLIRIDMPHDTCMVLNGNGGWTDVCNLGGGADFDWETDGTNVWTGHGQNGYPAGDVTIGTVPGNNAQLTVVDNFTNPNRSGVDVNVDASQPGLVEAHAISARINDHGNNFIVGVDATATGGTTAIGGRFISSSGQSQTGNIAGVAGYCFGSQPLTGNNNVIGVYGRAVNDIHGAKPIGVYGEATVNGVAAGLSGHFVGAVQGG